MNFGRNFARGTQIATVALVAACGDASDPMLAADVETFHQAATAELPVSPVLECVEEIGGALTAKFGYYNRGATPLTIPVGLNNRFHPVPIDRGQPTVFESNRSGSPAVRLRLGHFDHL